MELRPITEGYSVASQIEPDDIAALAEAGVTTLICNRPDAEVPPSLQAAAIQAAAEAAGIAFVYNPVIGTGMTHQSIEEQADAIDGSEGGVVAYCASGMRSSLMWAFAMAGRQSSDEILATVARAGFRMDHLKGQIDEFGEFRA
ncbi:TIGR01244 family phosphatase [Rhodobacterales bacterium HKCCE2091]|nr:TIGR01244 family phosphatase [Rhodobacterales bacterium HKCCE2091]